MSQIIPTPAAEVRSEQQTLPGLERLAITHIVKLKESKEAIKIARDALGDRLNEEEGYTEAFGKQSEGTKARKEITTKAMAKKDVAELSENLKEARQDAKNIKEGLSTYLGEYAAKSGKDTIEVEGKQRKIKRICSV